MYDIPLIKSRMSCVEYAQYAGLPIHKDGDRCKSPLRAGATNPHSFCVHNDYWFDFGSDTGGDVIDLAALLNYNGDRGLAIQELARLTGVIDDKEHFIDWRQATQRRCSDIAGWHEDLRPQDREYLHSRRITDETIDRLRIGYTGMGLELTCKGKKVYNFAANRIAIPFYKNGYVFSWVARAVGNAEPKYLKPPADELTEHEPWGLHTLDRKGDYLYIAEGAFDALSIDQSGFPVLATMGGHFSKETLKTVFAIAKDYKAVVLTFDNDEAGRGFTIALGKTLFSHRIPFKVAEIPLFSKDISDYYTAGHEIADLTLAEGITHLATNIKDKAKFKAFAYKAARVIDKAELAEMFQQVKKTEAFAEVWLKEVNASCFKSPLEPIIVKEILDKHKLLYVDGVGFYKYIPQGKWQLLSDQIIHGYISDALGTFTQGNKLEPIKKLMKPEVLTTQEFDRKNVVCFINGTLELDTGIFRENREDDYCSIQLPYPYLPDAKCSLWNTFIEQVTASDPKRAENLQFIAGYVLFPDCRHEKIFVLTGEGGNGKTVYTKILTQLFGPENVSNIAPIGLTEAFELIHLRSALLNISGEIKFDLTGTEEKMKAIASGEQIQACYKGKDFVKFISRAKLLFCCNGQLKASDTSEGLTRRLTIIDFPCKFVDYPEKDDPYQFQKDIYLYDKLLQELPGIFNWAYRGYKDLLHYGEFTETDEHQTLMATFMRSSNPILCFYEEFMDNPPEQVTKAQLYSRYQTWCMETGHSHPMAAHRFHQEFQKLAKKTYEIYSKSIRIGEKIGKERGYYLVQSDKKNNEVFL